MLSSIFKVLSRLNGYISSGRPPRCDFICPPFTDIVLFFLNDRIPYGRDSDDQVVSGTMTGALGSIYDEGYTQNAFETIHSEEWSCTQRPPAIPWGEAKYSDSDEKSNGDAPLLLDDLPVVNGKVKSARM